MSDHVRYFAIVAAILAFTVPALSQDAADEGVTTADPVNQTASAEASESETVSETPQEVQETAQETAQEIASKAKQHAESFAADVDASEQAQEVSAGILEPIYLLAESLEFPAFHWLAFALMAAGVVSFALQLVLGKLVALAKRGFSVTEILSDAVGFCISAIGLVLTTQAAAQNSTFTQSAFAVISATVVGAGFGFILYVWGQRQELQAIDARNAAAKQARKK